MKPEKRKAERDAYCSGCDKEIKKETEMISFYSYRNRGMWIHLCISCSVDIGVLALSSIGENNSENSS
jgi:hypothetical protein